MKGTVNIQPMYKHTKHIPSVLYELKGEVGFLHRNLYQIGLQKYEQKASPHQLVSYTDAALSLCNWLMFMFFTKANNISVLIILTVHLYHFA